MTGTNFRNSRARTFVAAIAAAGLLAVVPAVASAQHDLNDVPEDHFASAAVRTLDARGVFEGTLCGDGLFCPEEPLLRSEMAVWMVRVLDGDDPDPVTETRFGDVDGDHPHAAFVERFAELEVTKGCGDGTNYCPDGSVTRAQMASFLTRAYDLPAAGSAGFTDIDSVWAAAQADIDALAASEITVGCGAETLRFCPQDNVTRAQMAVFLVRADEYAQSQASPTVTLGSGWVVFREGYVPPRSS